MPENNEIGGKTMPEHQNTGMTRAGLALGITGTALGGTALVGSAISTLLGGYNAYKNVTGNAAGFRGYEHFSPIEHLATEKDIHHLKELGAKDNEITTLKAKETAGAIADAKLAPVIAVINEQAQKIGSLESAVVRLTTEVKHGFETAKRDVGDVYKYVDCTFVPQEKGYIDGSRINYHGVHPRLGLNHGDERFHHGHPHGELKSGKVVLTLAEYDAIVGATNANAPLTQANQAPAA